MIIINKGRIWLIRYINTYARNHLSLNHVTFGHLSAIETMKVYVYPDKLSHSIQNKGDYILEYAEFDFGCMEWVSCLSCLGFN